jgi:hypothetical protein
MEGWITSALTTTGRGGPSTCTNEGVDDRHSGEFDPFPAPAGPRSAAVSARRAQEKLPHAVTAAIAVTLHHCRIYVTDRVLSRSVERFSGEAPVGFESSRAARRRLAAVAATNKRVQEALSASSFPGFFGDTQEDVELAAQTNAASRSSSELHDQLDLLAHDIIATPGAGGALLVAYAAQARALTLVVEAAKRGGGAPLPAAVIHAAEAALNSPGALTGVPLI